ncbi:sigma-54-dependent Fis family transcriptional regulator [Ralstonia holmesii]|uniref:Acetoin catabolism regulatory protein n=1 Tax=Ralstonia holmesii TaxID=3058602 RepID=A0ABC8QJ51_9RALS|nr:sigma-54-dependent Fis family transcriptional regulator [Ralstonia sp. LMG 32967]CAJ0792836.1 Acetoin catabolism regulatory protein [Ralstonia sp. LMG 32967]CAJ0819550.1 Acetoin catabolism regulatory protein [Ralstonia sp. LMG 32967]
MQQKAHRAHIERLLAFSQQPGEAQGVIERSWRRCLDDYGRDPSRPTPAYIVEAQRLREHKDQIEDFLSVARTGMEQLYKRVSGLDYVLLLTDAYGVTVDFIGNDNLDRELKRSGLYLGADWSESRAGTCAVGTCIVEQAPVTCHQTDHFDACHITLTCNSAPLFDPTGNFLGVLDVSALSAPAPREGQHLALQMTAMYAQKIEDANFLRYFRDQWILRLGSTWSLVDVDSEIMVAFDGNGVIRGVNSGGRRKLRLESDPHADVRGHLLTEVFRENVSELWRIARAGTSSERTAIRMFDHGLYYATGIPPRGAPGKPSMPSASASAPALPSPEASAALEALGADDPQMQRLILQAKRLANKPLNILVQGETGTGKEVLAKALHTASERRSKAFVAVNCAAIPESLIESELFGYTPGTFTGARNKGMRGLIAQSDGGTLFLDEIGDMPLHLQSRLLRVLSEREVMPLGSEKPIPVDLRVIAASHRDLRQLIAEQRFREDLYYRLCGATLHLPTLRERCDKDYLIARIVEEEARQLDMHANLAPAALAVLRSYPWQGNVRQLRNVLRFALAMSDDGLIDVDALPPEVLESTIDGGACGASSAADAAPDNEREILLAALRRNKWRVTHVAHELGIARATVYRQMERFGIVAPNQQ